MPSAPSAAPAYRQQLPDLGAYRAELIAEGFPVPVPPTRFSAAGLLGELPPPPPGRVGWPWTVETAPFAADCASWPTFSIVIPSYQQGEFLEETLRSVILQNYPGLQIIVMDGGSTDGSAAVLERYRPWLGAVRRGRDRGQSHAINRGFALADGTLRGWINSDDFYLPGALRRVAEVHRRRRAEFIYGDQLILRSESGELELEPLKWVCDRYVKFAALVASHASFWTRECHEAVWEEQQCALDYELWIRLVPGRRRAYLPWPLGVVRHHPATKTASPRMKQAWLDDAARNGLAHPRLYRPRPWLDFEYRWVQAFVRHWRARRIPRTFAALRRECGWRDPAPRSAP